MFHDSDSDNLLKLLLTRTEILSRRVNDFVVVVVLEVVVALIFVDGRKRENVNDNNSCSSPYQKLRHLFSGA